MAGLSFHNRSLAARACALTAAALLAALYLASAARATGPESGPCQAPSTHDQDDGAAVLQSSLPPATEAGDRQEGGSSNIELPRWKLPVADLGCNSALARNRGRGADRPGAVATGTSKHSVQVLFCRWRI